MHDGLDDIPSSDKLGLWFRAQLNSDYEGEEDEILIDNIQILGQKVD